MKACAHRRRKRGVAFEWGLGLCISMTNALDEDGFWEPCEGKPKNRGHGEYGYCQAGISAAVDSVRSFTLLVFLIADAAVIVKIFAAKFAA